MYLVLILSLALITYLDFKERKVYLINLIISGLIMSYLFYKQSFLLNIYLREIVFNIFITSVIVSALYLYTKIKMKKKFEEAIGLGDLIFFFAIAIGFPTFTFIIIFIFSIIFSQIFFLILTSIKKLETVPLAGIQALFLIAIFILNSFFDIVNLYAM